VVVRSVNIATWTDEGSVAFNCGSRFWIHQHVYELRPGAAEC